MAAEELDEVPEKVWHGPGGAYRWAIEQASIPDCQSTSEVLRRQMMGGGGGSRWTPEDWRNLVYSIIGAVGGMKDEHPYAYAMFTYVYGEKGIVQVDGLASTLAQKAAPNLKYSLAKKMAQTALRRIRSEVRADEVRVGRAQYARDIGIRQPSLYSGRWQTIIQALEDTAWDYLRQGRNAAREQLLPLGVVS